MVQLSISVKPPHVKYSSISPPIVTLPYDYGTAYDISPGVPDTHSPYPYPGEEILLIHDDIITEVQSKKGRSLNLYLHEHHAAD